MLSKSKRMKLSMLVISLNFITFWIGIYFKLDLNNLGVGLMTINAPLLAYIMGETYRPSDKKE